MKTVNRERNKLSLAAMGLLTLSCGLSLTIAPALAGPMNASGASGLGPVPTVSPPPPADSLPTIAAPAPAPVSPTPMTQGIPVPAGPAGVEQNQIPKVDATATAVTKGLSSAEDKATDNAKSIVKHLDTSSEMLTLDDLNAARQAVARLDAMIEVEKHLADLEKLRNERTGGGHGGLASAIPASALLPPSPVQAGMPSPGGPLSPTPVSAVPVSHPLGESHGLEKPKNPAASMEVVRISGAEGIYVAVLKLDDGSSKPFKVGDHISDHAVVREISPSTVLVDVNGETHSLRVKNIDAIYSAMR